MECIFVLLNKILYLTKQHIAFFASKLNYFILVLAY